MSKLVEPEIGNLTTLPVVFIRLMLEVSKANSCSTGELPFQPREDRAPANVWVDLARLIPQAAFYCDLGVRSSKYDAGKKRDMNPLKGLCE